MCTCCARSLEHRALAVVRHGCDLLCVVIQVIGRAVARVHRFVKHSRFLNFAATGVKVPDLVDRPKMIGRE